MEMKSTGVSPVSNKPKESDLTVCPVSTLIETDLTQLAHRLLCLDVSDLHKHVYVSATECLTVCHVAIDLLKNQPVCLAVQPPLTIVGDIHGQFHDLLRLFDFLGKPPSTKYLFLGDYVDRGKFSIEVIMLLFTLMLTHPGSVYLLRGNHETANVCCRYGFKAEIQRRFPKEAVNKVLSGFLRAFQWLPMCAIVDDRFFCCHGGISPSFLLPPFSSTAGRGANVRVLSLQMCRPFEPQRPGIARDLLWSDPKPRLPSVYIGVGEEMRQAKWTPSTQRQCSFLFSGPALEQVMQVFRTHMLVRGHQLAQDGFALTHDKQCITLFSAPGYCGVQHNAGAFLQIQHHGRKSKEAGTFFILKPMKLEQMDVANLFWADISEPISRLM